ncbi:MAG TPA: DEAD/DEAH box helicase family protein, partial [Anaerovoracaceae bacterium]|nr:DEAD/DEAH box helicase family protein [Anaerovoracaceae bacterium]
MKYELFPFQKNAVSELLKKMESMQYSNETDGSLSAVALIAPTGAGKTVISAAVAEGLFYGNDTYAGNDRAVILWLSDSPSLNEQTTKRFEAATDLINRATTMEAIGPDFAKNHKKLMPGHIYFLNRQLLGKGKKLSNEAEGGRSFYDVLNDTIEDPDIRLYLFIDEAHKGLGTGIDKGTSDSANKTIYSIIIDGQVGINKPIPCVVGISATPERFQTAMVGRKNRDMKAPVYVPVSDVRLSGLIKDTIELRTPKKSADTKHQDLKQACVKIAESSKGWKDYCIAKNVLPVVIPLMVVQVEDKVTEETLASLCTQIHKALPWLDTSDCFANVFGEHEDITTPAGKIPYVKPEEVSEQTEIRVLFAKDAVSTGWDCPRAEVIYSRRKRSDPTYIAQLIGRMIRAPLARRIDLVEELNTVACYLPEYDSTTVESVIERLIEDNVAVAKTNIINNPVDVGFFGDKKKKIETKLAMKQNAESNPDRMGKEHQENNGNASGTSIQCGQTPKGIVSNTEFTVSKDIEFTLSIDDIEESVEELKAALTRIPKVDSNSIKISFEEIISRQVRHDKPNHFLDLWNCIDIITSDIDLVSNVDEQIQVEFYNNIEGEIHKHPAEFKRSLGDIKNTTVSVKRIDPLTGEAFEDHEELVENDADRLVAYYKHAVSVFAGASDLIKYFINR